MPAIDIQLILLPIYTRDAGGRVRYIGEESWESRQQALEHYHRDHHQPQREVMAGWPHNAVVWYGDIGFGE